MKSLSINVTSPDIKSIDIIRTCTDNYETFRSDNIPTKAQVPPQSPVKRKKIKDMVVISPGSKPEFKETADTQVCLQEHKVTRKNSLLNWLFLCCH